MLLPTFQQTKDSCHFCISIVLEVDNLTFQTTVDFIRFVVTPFSKLII